MTLDTDIIDRAHSVRIEDEITRRGVRLRGKVERVGPCPVCGGIDRFSVNTRKQLWNCRGCERGGDAIALVQHLDGCSFVEAVRLLAGDGPRPALARPASKSGGPRAQPDDNSQTALRIWDAAVPIENTPAESYLRHHRKLDIPDGVSGPALRFHHACPFGPAATHPCLVALVRSIFDDKPQGIHRTALNAGGGALKIDGKTARLSLGPIKHGAIKLTGDADVTTSLFIGEGIETVLAGMMLPRWWRPAWALISADNIRAFPVLSGIECLGILVDHDRPDKHGRRTGQAAAEECFARWHSTGREVIRLMPIVAGDDIADVAAMK
jgi:hypothetical protein